MNGVHSEPAEADVAVCAREKCENAKAEFAKRRRILITNLPAAVDEEDLKQNFLSGYEVKGLKVNGNTATVLLPDADAAREAVSVLNKQSFHESEVGLSFAPPDALLFVGNLPFEFTEEEFRELMSPFGPIERLFLIYSERTGKSKGYGFVEFLNQSSAIEGKQALMSSGSKYVGGRILRVDFAQANLISYDDLHSKTIFVDRLPRNLTDGEKLKKHFEQSGTVLFAQVAVNAQTGMSRGFAFVDFTTSEDAEKAQDTLNGSELEGSHIRVAFGTPGRSGAGILSSQQKNVGRGRGLPGGFAQTRALLGPRPLMGIDTQGPRFPVGLLGARPPLLRQALLGHGPRGMMRPGLLGRPRGTNWTPSPRTFLGGSLLGVPRMEPAALFGRLAGPRGLLGAKPQPPMPPQPLMPLPESATSQKKGEGNAGYALNQTGVPPNPQQPLLQMPPAVPTQQTAQLQTGQQAQTQQAAVNTGVPGYPTIAAVQGNASATSIPGISSLMPYQPANQMVAGMTQSPVLPSLMSVPVPSTGANSLTGDPQYMTTPLTQQSPLVTQVYSAQAGTLYQQPQQDPTQASQQAQAQPLMYAQPVPQLQGYPQYVAAAQQPQQQSALVPTQPQMFVQPGTAVQYQYQWPAATQPAAQVAAAVTTQPSLVTPGTGTSQWQQQGVVVPQQQQQQAATVPQMAAAYAAQYAAYQQQPVIGATQQPTAGDTALLQQPQVNYEPANQQPYIQAAPVSAASFTPVVAQKRPAEGSSAEPQPAYLAQDQSGQYYDAKRPRF